MGTKYPPFMIFRLLIKFELNLWKYGYMNPSSMYLSTSFPQKLATNLISNNFLITFSQTQLKHKKRTFWHLTQKLTSIKNQKNLGSPIHLANLSTLTIESLKFLQKLVLVNFFYSWKLSKLQKNIFFYIENSAF